MLLSQLFRNESYSGSPDNTQKTPRSLNNFEVLILGCVHGINDALTERGETAVILDSASLLNPEVYLRPSKFRKTSDNQMILTEIKL